MILGRAEPFPETILKLTSKYRRTSFEEWHMQEIKLLAWGATSHDNNETMQAFAVRGDIFQAALYRERRYKLLPNGNVPERK